MKGISVNKEKKTMKGIPANVVARFDELEKRIEKIEKTVDKSKKTTKKTTRTR